MELWKPATPELEPGSSLIALFSAGMFVPKIEYMCQSIMYEASYEMHAASRDGLSYSICVGQLHILVFHGYKQISSSNIANQSGFLAGSNVVYHYKKKHTHIHIFTCNSRTRNVELYAIFVPQRMFDICKHGGCAHSCVLSARAGLEPAGEKGIVPFLSVGGRFVALR